MNIKKTDKCLKFDFQIAEITPLFYSHLQITNLAVLPTHYIFMNCTICNSLETEKIKYLLLVTISQQRLPKIHWHCNIFEYHSKYVLYLIQFLFVFAK